jgi:transposase-like protein
MDKENEIQQRWTTKKKAALVISILKGEISSQEAARRNGLTVSEVEQWKDRFLLGAENALRSRPKEEDALKDEQIMKLERKVGQLVMDIDILKTAQKLRPTVPGSSEE